MNGVVTSDGLQAIDAPKGGASVPTQILYYVQTRTYKSIIDYPTSLTRKLIRIAEHHSFFAQCNNSPCLN